MITADELKALVEILNRMPATTAERLWLQVLVDRIAKFQAVETVEEVEK